MIELNFACKVVPLNQILRCSFGLNRTDVSVLMLLTQIKNEMSAEEISRNIGKDKTTIQRSVKVLAEKKLIHRQQLNLDKGGYVFIYSSASRNYIKERIYENFEKFKSAVGREIEKW